MLNLTLTNLLLCIFVMPFHIISGFAGEYVFGSSDYVRCCVCQTGLLNTVLLAVSVHTVSLMSVDRFIYLKRPILYSSIVTPKRMTVAIALVWCICIAISIPPLFGFGTILFSYTVVSCVVLFVHGPESPCPELFLHLATAHRVVRSCHRCLRNVHLDSLHH